MTPEEKGVIESAIAWYQGKRTDHDGTAILGDWVVALIHSCNGCNYDRHTCPGCGEPIGHTATDCGTGCTDAGSAHDPQCRDVCCRDAPDYRVGDTVTVGGIEFTKHGELPTSFTVDAPACTCPGREIGPPDEECPFHGRFPGQPTEPVDAPTWHPATLGAALAGDRIRIGEEETDVIRCSLGTWHADTSDAWRPKAWEHVELRMELTAVPGFVQYPPATPCEILCSPERAAILRWENAFPGSKVIEP